MRAPASAPPAVSEPASVRPAEAMAAVQPVTGDRTGDSGVRERALRVLRTMRVGVMIVAYDAERHIGSVLRRIPADIAPLLAAIYVLDDSSRDRTSEAAVAAGEALGLDRLRVHRTPANRGYGGNQKIGYTYAIEHGLDIVIMLHGDGQYPPEHLPDLIAAFDPAAAGGGPEVDVVLGSRMLRRRDALRGGMPLYKWIGNQVLTRFENATLGVSLAEFHTGYRAYRVSRLRQLPFGYGGDGFHFDTEILIQFIAAGCRIVEVPIPTHYGDEVCHVDGMRYAWDCVKDCLRYRLFRIGLLYDPLLDFNLFETETYYFKKDPGSLHQHVVRKGFAPGERVLEIGAAAGHVSRTLAERGVDMTAVDRERPRAAGGARALALDLDEDFAARLPGETYDTVLALDVIEHLSSPEDAVQRIARLLVPGGRVLASTANIAFLPMRLLLLLGVFNYGKRGILDKTHRRLFTIGSFRRLFERYGYEVGAVRGFGPPIRDLVSARFPFSWIDTAASFLARVMPRLFAYNFLIEARRLPSLDEVYQATLASGGAKPLAPARQEGSR